MSSQASSRILIVSESIDSQTVAQVKQMNVRQLGVAVKRGQLSVDVAYCCVAYWMNSVERRRWIESSNKALKRKDSTDNLREVLKQLCNGQ
jgi:hypothetical protein